MIFNIQKCSIHDGDGLRTLVFLKGCPMECLWCANPESHSYEAEIMEFPSRCIGCGICQKVCPEVAISSASDGFKIDRNLCTNCHKCAEHCYAEAKVVVGKDYSVEELFKEIEKDRVFYSMYGGGVTFSGGEPLTHPKFLTKIAKKCQENGINVVVESCGYGVYDEFEKALPYIDKMFLDIKHIDSDTHDSLTGKGNELILENIKRIAEFGIPVTARTPIVPGYNDSAENIIGISKFISTIPGIKEYELLAYHNLGGSKYKSLGRPYALEDVLPPSDQEMKKLVKCSNEILQNYDKECFCIIDNKREMII